MPQPAADEALRLYGSGLGRVEYRIGAFTTGAVKFEKPAVYNLLTKGLGNVFL